MPCKAELKISIHYQSHCVYDSNKYEHLAIVWFFLWQSLHYSPCGPEMLA